ncbi:MAG: hypothetical protein KC964_02895, partial [Candidatus Omnitrophica bacterium]|nr:hypothetical protein [Candidatus Omnitrophota bacterium]
MSSCQYCIIKGCQRARHVVKFLGCVVLFVLAVNSATSSDPTSIYQQGPFADLACDYFARFHRDPNAEPKDDETALTETWCIAVHRNADSIAGVMAQDLVDFLKEVMHLSLIVETCDAEPPRPCIFLTHATGTRPEFSISVEGNFVEVHGESPEGLRDGVVKLVDLMGFRQAPYLKHGRQNYTPRLALRVGAVPFGGSYRDAVFMGYNGVILSPTVDTRNGSPVDFMELSTSRALPEWTKYQNPDLLADIVKASEEAGRYNLKRFAMLRMWKALPKDDPVYVAHPEIRGALVHHLIHEKPWGYVACTEAPLVREYLKETMAGIAQALHLDGAAIIIGGEEFQHCFMRAAGVEPGHTNCLRCEALGADTVV